MASTYLTRTFGSAGNRQSWTWSGWIKKTTVYNSTDSGDREVWFGGYTASNNTEWLEFGTQGDVFYFTTSGISNTGNRSLRDTNGWFHAVVTYNGSNLKFYHNNELDFDNTELSGDRGININGTHTIGAIATNQSIRRFTGAMSHVHFIDGTIYTPSDFGETDSTTGIWRPKTAPSVTYGTNGFFLKFESSGSMGTDSSGNGNNFTVSGNLTQTEDSPSNNFATMNPLDNYYTVGTFTNGNNTVQTSTSGKAWVMSTLGMSSGKYYFEAKYSASGGTNPGDTWNRIGISDHSATSNSDLGSASYQYAIVETDGSKYVNGTNSTYAASWSTGDIIGCAIDLDNNKIYWHKNGAWANGSGSWSSSTFDANTGDVSITAASSTATGFYFVAMGDAGVNVNKTWNFNFGNGYFGTTAVSSAGTNASNIGVFEYDVPTGFTALCTKGLNS